MVVPPNPCCGPRNRGGKTAFRGTRVRRAKRLDVARRREALRKLSPLRSVHLRSYYLNSMPASAACDEASGSPQRQNQKVFRQSLSLHFSVQVGLALYQWDIDLGLDLRPLCLWADMYASRAAHQLLKLRGSASAPLHQTDSTCLERIKEVLPLTRPKERL